VPQFADAGLVGCLLTGRWTMRVHAVPATITVAPDVVFADDRDFAAELEELYR